MICYMCNSSFDEKNSLHKFCSAKCRNRSRPPRKDKMKAYRRKSNLKVFYGLTISGYEAMLARSEGGCYLCGKPPRGARALAVDHCHTTGRVRGLLCDICNRHVIGNKDYAFFERCIEYMKEPKVEEA